jgi:hypothetical protein
MQPTSTSNIGLQVTVKLGLALSLTVVQMEKLQVMMIGSLTAQDDKLMYKALTTIKLLIFPLLQLELLQNCNVVKLSLLCTSTPTLAREKRSTPLASLNGTNKKLTTSLSRLAGSNVSRL